MEEVSILDSVVLVEYEEQSCSQLVDDCGWI